MIAFFATFDSPDLRFMPALSPVWSMYTKFLMAMAITFQMPTVVFFLARMRLVTARFLLKHLKYAILIIFIVAALVTPGGDPGTQAVFAAPMLLLYLFSIAIAWIVAPRHLCGFRLSCRLMRPGLLVTHASASTTHMRLSVGHGCHHRCTTQARPWRPDERVGLYDCTGLTRCGHQSLIPPTDRHVAAGSCR